MLTYVELSEAKLVRGSSQWRRTYDHGLTFQTHLIGGEYDEVDEELKELDEGHDGEAEPQTEHTA